jgi:hypothetical protein
MKRRNFLAAGVAGLAAAGVRPGWTAVPEDEADEPVTPAPAHATVLFGGKDLSAWVGPKGGPPGWKVENGYLEIVLGAGGLYTREHYRDFQLHAEFRIPENDTRGQGNSGFYLQGKYEIQIFDSYGREHPQPNGCGALYLEVPPLRNVCKKAGRWQSFDIAFRAPRYDAAGQELKEKGLITVLHNRVLIHNNVQIPGMTGRAKRDPSNDPRKPGPIEIQNHNSPVRFRNIWIVPL